MRLHRRIRSDIGLICRGFRKILFIVARKFLLFRLMGLAAVPFVQQKLFWIASQLLFLPRDRAENKEWHD
jgi:hypothetical protein